MDQSLVLKAAEIAAAYVSRNDVAVEDLPRLIETLARTLAGLSENIQPSVPVEESVTDDYIICLEDGQKVTLLKRYLSKNFDMTPEEYIEKWGLPEDYPMVTKTYSETRSRIAKEQGLGKRS